MGEKKDKRPRHFPAISSSKAKLGDVDRVTHGERTIFEGPAMMLVPLSPQGSLWGRRQHSRSFNTQASIMLVIFLPLSLPS